MKRTLAMCAMFGVMAVTRPALADNQPGTAAAINQGFHGVAHQHYTLYVLPGNMGFVGPDKAHHDTIAPSDFVLKAGVPVTFTVINFDDGGHSITAPALGVNIKIKPGIDEANGGIKPVATTYTFTPTKKGEFHWNCMVMCDGPSHWAMSAGFDGPGRDGYMAGWFKVL
jgi:heme/copper-type cytochrome/quinol oxidase subunit 2